MNLQAPPTAKKKKPSGKTVTALKDEREGKRNFMTVYMHHLLTQAHKAIDAGKLDKDFCPGCVLSSMVIDH